MTNDRSKEKAKELIEKYFHIVPKYSLGSGCKNYKNAKQCALIAVDEILSEYAVLQIETSFCYEQIWLEVKQEIENYEG